jgi:hypothetical protein
MSMLESGATLLTYERTSDLRYRELVTRVWWSAVLCSAAMVWEYGRQELIVTTAPMFAALTWPRATAVPTSADSRRA